MRAQVPAAGPLPARYNAALRSLLLLAGLCLGSASLSYSAVEAPAVVAWGSMLIQNFIPPEGARHVRSMTVGTHGYLSLLSNGTVVCWGGHGRPAFVPRNATSQVVQVAAFGEMYIALRRDGVVVPLTDVRLYREDYDDWTKIPAAATKDVVQIYAGPWGSCAAVTRTGHAVFWGSTLYNDTWLTAVQSHIKQVAWSDTLTAVLLTNGTVLTHGLRPDLSITPAEVNHGNVVGIAGSHHSFWAALRDGTIVEFSPGGPPFSSSATVYKAMGPIAVLGPGVVLLSNGTLATVATSPQINIPTAARQGVIGVVLAGEDTIGDTGGRMDLVLKNTGQLIGFNGQANVPAIVPPGLRNIIRVRAAAGRVAAISTGGALTVWGAMDSGGRLHMQHGAVDVALASDRLVAILANSSLYGWPALKYSGYTYSSGPYVDPTTLTGVIKVAIGSHHTVALLRNNTAICWHGSTPQGVSQPCGIHGARGVVDVAAGPYFSVALYQSGKLGMWGMDEAFCDQFCNALGCGCQSLPKPHVPDELDNLTVMAIAAGTEQVACLLSNGSIVTFDAGYTSFGSLPTLKVVHRGPATSISLADTYGLATLYGDVIASFPGTSFLMAPLLAVPNMPGRHAQSLASGGDSLGVALMMPALTGDAYGRCKRRASSPYQLSHGSASTKSNTTTLCWQLGIATDLQATSDCTKYNLSEVLLQLPAGCSSIVLAAKLNGTSVAVDYIKFLGAATSQVARMRSRSSILATAKQLTAKPTPLCVTLHSTCTKQAAPLCSSSGSCRAWFVSADKACCPSQSLVTA